jgi:hypothetical protein
MNGARLLDAPVERALHGVTTREVVVLHRVAHDGRRNRAIDPDRDVEAQFDRVGESGPQPAVDGRPDVRGIAVGQLERHQQLTVSDQRNNPDDVGCVKGCGQQQESDRTRPAHGAGPTHHKRPAALYHTSPAD